MKLNKSKMKDERLITDITLKPQEPDDKMSKQENTCDCFVLSFNYNSGGEKIPFEINLSIKETNRNIFGKQHWVTLHTLKDNSVTFDVNMELQDSSGIYTFALYQIMTKDNNDNAQDVQETCLLHMLSKCIQTVQSNYNLFDSDHLGLTVLNKKIKNIKLPTLSNEDRQKIDSPDFTEKWNEFKEQNKNKYHKNNNSADKTNEEEFDKITNSIITNNIITNNNKIEEQKQEIKEVPTSNQINTKKDNTVPNIGAENTELEKSKIDNRNIIDNHPQSQEKYYKYSFYSFNNNICGSRTDGNGCGCLGCNCG